MNSQAGAGENDCGSHKALVKGLVKGIYEGPHKLCFGEQQQKNITTREPVPMLGATFVLSNLVGGVQEKPSPDVIEKGERRSEVCVLQPLIPPAGLSS